MAIPQFWGEGGAVRVCTGTGERKEHPLTPLQSLPREGNSCNSFLGWNPRGFLHTRGEVRSRHATTWPLCIWSSRFQLPPDAHHGATITLPKSREVRRDKDKNLAQRYSPAAAFSLVTPKIPYAYDTSHRPAPRSDFQVRPPKIATEETSHEPAVSSPPFLLPCKAQSELISLLAPRLLFS